MDSVRCSPVLLRTERGGRSGGNQRDIDGEEEDGSKEGSKADDSYRANDGGSVAMCLPSKCRDGGGNEG